MHSFSFVDVFRKATGNDPYPYQCSLAEGSGWPKILKAPTGTGKTAAATLAWVWKRRFHAEQSVRDATPRRLVYCLPMRVLVEQTRDNVSNYLQALGLLARPDATQAEGAGIGVYVLMGGDMDDEWQLYPERDAVIIGTQDMLLSRVLNRGFVLSRFRWPIPYGLLNNDALWVLDEVQLMGAGIPTTAQLAGFRNAFGTTRPCLTMWMSATIQPSWLRTVDHQSPDVGESLGLDLSDQSSPGIATRLQARKELSKLVCKATVGSTSYPADVAQQVVSLHRDGTQTIVMMNTVQRAQQVYRALVSRKPARGAQASGIRPEVVLVHSRLRPPDRRNKLDRVLTPVDQGGPGRIIVCTQVFEAGVDISSALLVTELAPWSSLVQRFGRCNRFGEYKEARVRWIDVPENRAAPYDGDALEIARGLLEGLEGQSVAPSGLPEPNIPPGEYEVIRRKDLLDLFDTAPDLSGNDVDVSRFIRDAANRDVWVCWREWPREEHPPADWLMPSRDELCPVPIGELRTFLNSKSQRAFTWDHLDRRWRRLPSNELWPGRSVVLHCNSGGYDPEVGWDPATGGSVMSLEPVAGLPNEASGDDHHTFAPGVWQTLAEHSEAVVAEMALILKELQQPDLQRLEKSLHEAARRHDYGKSHAVFQETLLNGLEEPERGVRFRSIWAKAVRSGPPRGHARPHFRHELAGLLGLLGHENKSGEAGASDLVLYLIASHHGRVRLGVRSFPGRDGANSTDGSTRRLLGIEDGDHLPSVDLGDGVILPPVTLRLSPAEIGDGPSGRSWLTRSLALRDDPDLGPFRLGYLEALLRAADVRASAKAAKGGAE